MFDPFLTDKQILRKLGGDRESKKVSILDVSLAEDAETPGFTVYRDLSDVTPFELGKTYTVHLDSGSYECVAKAMDGIGNVLGNTAFGGGADTGETFLVAITGGIAMVMDASCGTKASVTANVETIVPIDQKYLPGVCLPVVELSAETMTAIFTSGSADATAEEASVIISAKNNLVPLCVRGNFNGMVFAVTASLSSDGNSTGYAADFGGTKLYFEITDNSVAISMQA